MTTRGTGLEFTAATGAVATGVVTGLALFFDATVSLCNCASRAANSASLAFSSDCCKAKFRFTRGGRRSRVRLRLFLCCLFCRGGGRLRGGGGISRCGIRCAWSLGRSA